MKTKHTINKEHDFSKAGQLVCAGVCLRIGYRADFEDEPTLFEGPFTHRYADLIFQQPVFLQYEQETVDPNPIG